MKILENEQLESVFIFKYGLVFSKRPEYVYCFWQLRKFSRTGEPTCMFKLGPLLISVLKRELTWSRRNWTAFSMLEQESHHQQLRVYFYIILKKAGNISLDFVSCTEIKRYILITFRMVVINTNNCVCIQMVAFRILTPHS